MPIHAAATVAALLLLAGPAPTARADDIRWPAAVSDRALVAIEIADGARWVDLVERFQIVERLHALPSAGEFLASGQGQQLTRLVSFLEARFDQPVAEVARSILAGSWTIAAVLTAPSDELAPEVRPIIVVQPTAPERVRTVLAMLGLFAGNNQKSDASPDEKLPRELTPLGTLTYTWAGDTLLIGTDDPRGRHLIAHYPLPRSSELPSDATPGAMARVVTDLNRLRELVGFDPASLAAANPEPLGDLLFGGMARWVARAGQCEVAIDTVAQTLTLRGRAETSKLQTAKPILEQLGAFFPSTPTQLFPMPPNGIARLDLGRNLADWFDHRRQWIAPSAQAGIDEFLVNFGNLTGGLAFDEDILTNLPGPLQIFALRAPALDPVPTPRFPGFAVVSPLGEVDPADFERRMRLALQSTVTFINFEQGTGQAPYLVESERYRDARISRAVPVPAPGASRESRERIEFNFAPAVAVIDGHAIIASHDDAIRQWIDVLRDAPAAGRSSLDAHTRFHVEPSGLARILTANRESLVAGEVLEGNSIEKARAEIEAFITVVDWFEEWTTESSVVGDTLHVSSVLRVEPFVPTTEATPPKAAGGTR